VPALWSSQSTGFFPPRDRKPPERQSPRRLPGGDVCLRLPCGGSMRSRQRLEAALGAELQARGVAVDSIELLPLAVDHLDAEAGARPWIPHVVGVE